jgi:hypothetical protein
MTVADVQRVGADHHALRRTGFAADHEIVATQIQLLEGERHEWKVLLIVPTREGQAGDKSGRDSPRGELTCDQRRIRHVRIDIRLWKQICDGFENLLAAAPVEQPIVD